jgi:thiol-disulfide isomerase/thioredoxin
MTARRLLLAAGSMAAALLLSVPAIAADWKPFSAEALAAAQKDGKPILIDVFAPWCGTCRAQKPIIQDLTAKPEFKDMVVLEIDFDSQKDEARALKAQSRNTLITFKGETETGRSVGDTDRASIEALLKSAL